MDTTFIILIVIAAILVFMAGREIACWYFKINEQLQLKKDQINLQQETNSLLKKLLDK